MRNMHTFNYILFITFICQNHRVWIFLVRVPGYKCSIIRDNFNLKTVAVVVNFQFSNLSADILTAPNNQCNNIHGRVPHHITYRVIGLTYSSTTWIITRRYIVLYHYAVALMIIKYNIVRQSKWTISKTISIITK